MHYNKCFGSLLLKTTNLLLMKLANQKLKHIIIRSYFIALAEDSYKPLIHQMIPGSVSNGEVMEFMYSLIKVKFLIGSAWLFQMLWTQTHAAMHLHALSGEKNKAPTKLHSLCWIRLNQGATVWSGQRKAYMVIIWNFPAFTFNLLFYKSRWFFDSFHHNVEKLLTVPCFN